MCTGWVTEACFCRMMGAATLHILKKKLIGNPRTPVLCFCLYLITIILESPVFFYVNAKSEKKIEALIILKLSRRWPYIWHDQPPTWLTIVWLGDSNVSLDTQKFVQAPNGSEILVEESISKPGPFQLMGDALTRAGWHTVHTHEYCITFFFLFVYEDLKDWGLKWLISWL